MKRDYSIGLLISALSLVGCGDDTPAEDGGSSTGDVDTSGSPTGSPTTMPPDDSTGAVDTTGGPTTTGVDSSSGGDSSTGEPLPSVEFFVRIENISDQGLLTTAFSPGVWANHSMSGVENFFMEFAPEPGEGLEALAEDGDPTTLAMNIMDNTGFAQTGVFDTPVGAGAPAPIMPGEMYEFTFVAEPFTRLSLATMLVGSNDLLMSTGEQGVSLFVGNGTPQGERDVTDSIKIWEIGTEASQAPGQGPNQPAIGGPGVGPSEAGEVTEFASSTRAIPLASALVDVTVSHGDGVKVPAEEYTITLTNISEDYGTLVSPWSPMVWVQHDDTVGLFTEGMPASVGLQALAEDGITDPLVLALAANVGVADVGTVNGPGPGPDPIPPGESVQIIVTATPAAPYLSFAGMVVQTNDAFLSMGQYGVALLDAAGLPRSSTDVRLDIEASLGVWDAGTEANEVPGVGPNQAPRQPGLNTGAADPDTAVRRYIDATNDLAGASAGGFALVEVNTSGGGGIPDYTVTITNTSDTIAYPGVLTPTVWTLHDDTFVLFDEGVGASAGLEMLAEDGDPLALLTDVMGNADSGVADTPVGAGAPGPLLPGESYEFTVTPDAVNRFLSFASMIVPSNDTFLSPVPGGVALVDAAGAPIDAAVVEADIAAALRAWDAGTENNQSGAAGRDMAPFGAPNTGPPEGSGVVRIANDDGVWPVPDSTSIIRVTVGPVR